MTVLTVTAAGVRDRRRWLFQDLTVTASAGDIVAIVGPPGSGRTTVLLALAKRFRLSSGRVEASGPAALGHVPGVSEPESVLTVAEHVRERALLAGRRRAADVTLHGLDPDLRGFALSPYQRQVLGIVLAQVSQPEIIALDAVDEGLDAGERQALWALIEEMAEGGTTVLVTAREVDEARVSTVIRLGETADREALVTPSDVDGGGALGLVAVPDDPPPVGLMVMPSAEMASVSSAESAPAPSAESAPVRSAEPEAEPEAGSTVELGAEPGAELEREPTAERGVDLETEATAESDAELEAESVAEPGVEPAAESGAESAIEPGVEPAAEPATGPNAGLEAEPATAPEAEPVAEPGAELETEPTAEPATGPNAETATAPLGDSAAVPRARVAVADAPEPATTVALQDSDSTKNGGETK
ncbi:ATP-binding cassette domain-containing protein [Couchioplanes caeruleus]|uniref:ABC transporter ATP-binding protein n=1 Tax=Couchioplanes caeruleus TaxID=56438 RepID=UPI00201C3DDF|nr:ABC transporter ATP-binding protein [Couchioplanes caeruleus]UQU66274.1 ATP-binding cassette domain-containing protein [Couchioplanes caeruleus]